MKKNIIIKLTVLIIVMFITLLSVNTVFATESKDTPKLSEGVYSIKSALNEKFVFDIAELSKNNGGNLQLWSNAKSDNQKFKIKYLGQDTYTISPVHSGKYIDLEGSSKKIGTNVMQWQYHGASNQQWIIKDVGNGYFNIISKCSGLYLDIPRSDCKDGANVQVWEKNNCKNQMFKFETTTSNPSTPSTKPAEPSKPTEPNKPSDPIATGGKKTIENGTYFIKSASNNKVLDVNQSSMVNGGNVGFWANGSTANQKFSVTYIGDGYYSISAQHSGKYIKKSDNANVNQGEYNGKNEEQWIIKEAENGYYYIISKANSQYLTQTSSGNAEISKANNSNNQKFKFEIPTPMKGNKTILDGTYIIASGLNNKLVLDIPRSSTKDGEILEIWNNGRTDNQKFEVKYIGDGYYTIKAKHSGKVIDVMGANKVIGTKVQQYVSNSTDAQKWIIKEAGNGYYYIISKCSELSMDVTNAEAANGAKIQMYTPNYTNAQKFKFMDPNAYEIAMETGTYGVSGLKMAGKSGGSDLRYFKYGSGPNVFFATFCVHGFEDNWPNDGTELVEIAGEFWERLKASNDYNLAEKWTIYIFPEVNPDGRKYGWTNNGPGRTTLYSAAPGNKGIDLNRCWSSDFKYYSDNRNYTGSVPFQAYEARYLRDFLLSHKSKDGQTILVDLHGWTQQLIGDSDIRGYYRKQFPENTDTPTYGKGYLINWARNNLGSSSRAAKSALIELPSYISGPYDVTKYNIRNRYINATLEMLRRIV